MNRAHQQHMLEMRAEKGLTYILQAGHIHR